MTHDDLISMAKKAGINISGSTLKELERFAKLISEFDPVRAAREAEKEQALTRMAKEAGWGTGSDREDECVACGRFDLELFAALVADEDREACAQVCETHLSKLEHADKAYNNGVKACVEILRARGEE